MVPPRGAGYLTNLAPMWRAFYQVAVPAGYLRKAGRRRHPEWTDDHKSPSLTLRGIAAPRSIPPLPAQETVLRQVTPKHNISVHHSMADNG